MRIILVGYPGSQRLLPFSKYLTSRYLSDFEIIYLNYEGKIAGWSNYVVDYLLKLGDEKVILSLDDFLIRSAIDMDKFKIAKSMKPCVKLCYCTEQEHKEYPVTLQYTIWNRIELISLLRKTTTPWDFEINGSKLFKGTSVVYSCMDYDTHSALSARWVGTKLDGIKLEDLEHYGQI